MNLFDLLIQEYFSSTRVPFLTDFFHLFTKIFDADIYFVVLVLITAVYINYYKNWRTTLLFLNTLFLTALLVLFLKTIFNTDRPENAVIQVLGGSFPSYHTASAVTFFLSLYYIFRDKLHKTERYPVLFFCIFFIFIISFSRIYLGVHWFSDIIGGILVGVFMVFNLKRYLKLK